MLKILAPMWRKRQRSIDVSILWPACVDQAADLDHARAAFAVHAFNDSAWTEDFDESQIISLIDDLKAPC